MANITAADVNKLRTATGAGMMDCKKALVEADGDFELAIENLRKKGQKVAANRSDRESTEGAAIAVVNADKTAGVVITLNCETDFVGMNENFVKMATEMANLALKFNTKEEFLAADFNGITVAEKLIEQTGVIGEKLEIRTFEKLEGAFIGSYIHSGNKIATIVALSANIDGAEEAVLRIGVASGERMVWAEPQDSVSGITADILTSRNSSVHEVIDQHEFVVSAESFFQSSPQAATVRVALRNGHDVGASVQKQLAWAHLNHCANCPHEWRSNHFDPLETMQHAMLPVFRW